MRTVVGVLRGGPSSEYEVSLKSGANILQALDREKYDARDIFIDKSGTWHVHGIAMPPERALKGVDVAFNVVHGEYGEDGQLHRILDDIVVPYTGSQRQASMLAFNKHDTKQVARSLGIRTPHSILVNGRGDLEQKALELFRTFPHPAIVKPVIGGSSVGMTLANSFHALFEGLKRALGMAPKAMLEEYIAGKEATVGVIEHFRNEPLYALMPVEIIPPAKHGFFTYEAKYGGETLERVPGNFSDAQKAELAHAAKKMHEALDLKHYSRSDFIVSPRGVYFLESNNASAVGMTQESLMPKAIEAVGAGMPQFVEHVVLLAQGKHRG